uniref:Uncharacterized protein n=1 Tax=Tanacetum cinerariifolium TaxID=118510 RepID=A0A6L2MI78_TANCI|nr:hypothetical protein [Tanacetum cinerariifolium]
MKSTRASISKASKRPKINIIPPKQLFEYLTQDNTKNPSPKLQLSSPSAHNAPSKTPSTKDTSSSSIDYTPKLPMLSSSSSTNGYLSPPMSPPRRVPPPPPTQDEGPGLEDEGPGSEDEGPGSKDEGLGSEEEEAAPEGQQHAVSVVDTTTDELLGLRRCELALGEGSVPITFEIG